MNLPSCLDPEPRPGAGEDGLAVDARVTSTEPSTLTLPTLLGAVELTDEQDRSVTKGTTRFIRKADDRAAQSWPL